MEVNQTQKQIKKENMKRNPLVLSKPVLFCNKLNREVKRESDLVVFSCCCFSIGQLWISNFY